MAGDRAALQRGERLVDRDDPGAGDDAFGRHARERLAQALEQRVLDPVERREVHMATLGFEDLVAILAPQQLRDAEPGARATDRRDALGRQRCVGAAEVDEVAARYLRDGMADRAEIVDDDPLVGLQPLGDQRLADDPRVAGEADDVVRHRRGDRDRQRAGKGAAEAGLECLIGGLKRRVVRGLHRRRLAQRNDAAILDLGDREARVRPADVCSYDFHVVSPNPCRSSRVAIELVEMAYRRTCLGGCPSIRALDFARSLLGTNGLF